ncbi:MAG: hypothetical protein NWE93_14735 [Candidatus Bathyarchaeota archaeon]|nr:hypothetical protein [Candidatus Bathyarchaeota archaeon]
MDRTQAINLCREIQSSVPELSPQGISFLESGPNNSISLGYTINLTGVCAECRRKIRQLIKNYPLEVNEGDNYLIIYTPRAIKNI